MKSNIWVSVACLVIMFLLSVIIGSVSILSEPATMLLFGTGLVGLAGTRLSRKK